MRPLTWLGYRHAHAPFRPDFVKLAMANDSRDNVSETARAFRKHSQVGLPEVYNILKGQLIAPMVVESELVVESQF